MQTMKLSTVNTKDATLETFVVVVYLHSRCLQLKMRIACLVSASSPRISPVQMLAEKCEKRDEINANANEA